MTAAERRSLIQDKIRDAGGLPVTAASLARAFGVSRQVIVQDVALLRAGGSPILATPSGYTIVTPRARPHSRVFYCKHLGLEALRRELYIFIEHGGLITDVLIEHPVYGEFRAMLMINTRGQADSLCEQLSLRGAYPLSSLTGGAHYHLIEAQSEQALDDMEAALSAEGLLCGDGRE